MTKSERDKKNYAAMKSDPVRYAAFLERKRRERKIAQADAAMQAISET